MRVAPVSLPAAARRAGLVLYFGSRAALADGARHRDLMRACPQALLLGCSTGGHGSGPDIGDDDILGVALAFRATGLRLAAEDGATVAGSRECGLRLGRQRVGCCRREQVSRELGAMVDEGLAEKIRGGLVLLQPHVLEKRVRDAMNEAE